MIVGEKMVAGIMYGRALVVHPRQAGADAKIAALI